MKILVTAMALVLAVPAAAQTAPSGHQAHPQQTGQHDQHQGEEHARHGQHQPGQHDGHDMASGCCADRNGNGRMDCCENMAQGHEGCGEHGDRPARQQAQPSGHQNH